MARLPGLVVAQEPQSFPLASSDIWLVLKAVFGSNLPHGFYPLPVPPVDAIRSLIKSSTSPIFSPSKLILPAKP